MENKEFRTVAELIEELQKYPPDMKVATSWLPDHGVCIQKRRCEREIMKNKFEDFDYVNLI